MRLKVLSVVATCVALLSTNAIAETAPFESGWSIDADASSLNFVSVKKGSVMELSRFATLEGAIDEAGNVTLQVPLDSVDTTVDLRNVRMRFLFFETFLHPHATISTQITPEMVADLEAKGTKSITLPFSISLHGVTKDMSAEVLIHMIGPDRVSVSSIAPIFMKVADFDLTGGLEKLQEAAEVVIVPATSVTFNFAFDRNVTTSVAPTPQLVAANTALEPQGAFSREACEGRFEILSRSGNINFRSNAADLRPESAGILASVADIVNRCPGMRVEIAGHTDSVGSPDYNLKLSEQRAQSVVEYLVDMGISSSRFESRGYGEARPIASERTAAGRKANRRIEFNVVGFDPA